MLEEPKGLYLYLWHGRDFPSQELEDWGKPGPCIGPLSQVHSTYRHSTVQVTVGDHDMSFLTYYEDLIFYDGIFYGDFTVIPEPRIGMLVEQWADDKAVLPEEYQPKKPAEEEESFKCAGCSFIYTDMTEKIKLSHCDGMFCCKECHRDAGIPEEHWGKTDAEIKAIKAAKGTEDE